MHETSSRSSRNQLLRGGATRLHGGRPVGLQPATFQNELFEPAVSEILVAASGPAFTQQGTQPRAMNQPRQSARQGGHARGHEHCPGIPLLWQRVRPTPEPSALWAVLPSPPPVSLPAAPPAPRFFLLSIFFGVPAREPHGNGRLSPGETCFLHRRQNVRSSPLWRTSPRYGGVG